MQIDFINHPFAFTNTGERLNIADIKGNVRIGVTLTEENGKYIVNGNNADPDCVGGVCPIK